MDGEMVFRRRVGPSEPNDFFKKALPAIEAQTRLETKLFEKWLVDL